MLNFGKGTVRSRIDGDRPHSTTKHLEGLRGRSDGPAGVRALALCGFDVGPPVLMPEPRRACRRTKKPPPPVDVPTGGGGLMVWRWRESNPRPSTPSQGFSGRSLLCFSRPRQSRRRVADGPSHCLVSRSPPWPGRAVEPSSDARHRAEGTPGLTVVSLLRQRGPGNPGLPQCAWNWHLLFAVTGLTRLCPQSSARFTWLAKSKSKPVTPCVVVNTPGVRVSNKNLHGSTPSTPT